MKRWFVTLEVPDDLKPEQVVKALRGVLPLEWKEVQMATGDWAERDDVTHACPICFDQHLPAKGHAWT
jgi:hypothetical protein